MAGGLLALPRTMLVRTATRTPLPAAVRTLCLTRRIATAEEKTPPPLGVPYSELTVGVPRESAAGERRVAQSPGSVAALTKAGFGVRVERGAGAEAQFRDADYEAAGAVMVDRNAAFAADVVCKVNPPAMGEPSFSRG